MKRLTYGTEHQDATRQEAGGSVRVYGQTIDEQAAASSAARQLGNAALAEKILESDSYFIEADFAALVGSAAAVLPEDVEELLEQDFPAKWGWISFAEPNEDVFKGLAERVLSPPATTMLSGKFDPLYELPLDGIGWAVLELVPPYPILVLYPWVGGTLGNPMVHSLHRQERDGTDWEGVAPGKKWFKSLWVLISQERVVAESEDMPVPRVFSRRADPRQGSTIRVIRLPRVVREHGGGEQRTVEWKRRWIVSGHWRNQPFGPGRLRHRPVWIAPYIKGPDGLPVGGQAKRLFVVSR